MSDPFSGSASSVVEMDPYDPEPERERIRGRITLATTILFGLVVMMFLVAALVSSADRWSRSKEAMGVVLPAVTSVVGTVLGFYFGSQKR